MIAKFKDALTGWMPKFDALSQRERALVAAAVIGGVLMVGNSLFIDRPLAVGKILAKQLQAERAELEALQVQMLDLRREIRDPDEDNRQRAQQLRGQLQEVRSALSDHQRLLVQPQEIPELLEKLLARHAALRLLGLKTLETVPGDEPAKPVLPVGPAADGKPAAPGEVRKEVVNVWKHGVEIRVQGNYADLVAYLSDLERLPQRLIWGEVRLKSDYPNSELLVRIYTYSLDQAWLKL
jgi:MSHA biogenesis protein MshJ